MMLALWLLACSPPETSDLFTSMSMHVDEDAGPYFADVIDAAEDELRVALPEGEDTEVTEAIIAAWDRGADVQVVTDVDQQEDAGIADLLDAGVPVRLADGAVTYFDFAINDDVSWSSDKVIMSHAWAIADGRRAVAASSAGGEADGRRVVFELTGEDLLEDMLTEHVQLWDGVDATAMTAYSAPAKSIADLRWSYPTDRAVLLEMWLGPQERVTKRAIDAVYRAHSSVWIISQDIANEGLAKALQDKAARGFDVRVVVGAPFGEVSPGQSRVLEDDTPDVEKTQVALERLPTVVLVDLDDPTGERRMAQAMIISHPLYSSARLHNGQEVVNDQLIDGAMWTLDDWGAALSPELTDLRDLFLELEDMGEAL